MTEEIKRLKKEKNAVILAHYYVPGEVQAIADYVGDSYYLSRKAVELEADILVFCGVRFMGESAKLLNPRKKVLMPSMDADCALAHMVVPSDIEKVRRNSDDLAVVSYINSTAEIKAHSDVCVTSSNAVTIVKKLPQRNIYFIPDRNLGSYVAAQVPEKNIRIHDGFCPVHERISLHAVRRAKKAHPDALFLAHPECRAEVLKEADYVGSTSGIISYASSGSAREFIIGTETGVFYELLRRNPDKVFHAAEDDQICRDMKKISLEDVLKTLKEESNEIHIDGDLRERAVKPLEKMLELGD